MNYLQIILLVSSLVLTTEATFFKKLVTPVAHTEQVLPLEPAPVFENNGEVINPALLPPPSLYSIQPVHHYVSLAGYAPSVLPHSFYPFLHGGAYAQSSANAGTFLYQPQTQLQGLDQQAAYNAALTHRYAAASEEIHNQRLIEAAREQAAYNSAAQANAIANAQNQQFTQQQFAPQQQGFDVRNFNSAQNNAAIQQQQFAQNNEALQEQQFAQNNAALQQQQFSPPNQYGVPIQAFNNLQPQNFNAAQSTASNDGFVNQRFGSGNQYIAPQEQSFNSARAQSNAAATASSGQNQQLFSPYTAASTHSTSATASSAHSSSVLANTPLATLSSSQSFASSSSASSSVASGTGITPYSIPSSSASSSSASNAASSSASAVNVVDNFIVPSASYGTPL